MRRSRADWPTQASSPSAPGFAARRRCGGSGDRASTVLARRTIPQKPLRLNTGRDSRDGTAEAKPFSGATTLMVAALHQEVLRPR